MTRLVFVTQHVDPGHPALAATVPKIRALAARVDELVVLALSAAPAELPPNCRVRTFGASSRLGRGVRFAAALAAELRARPLGVVAHMCPIYAVLAAPLARPLRVPVLLWYTHWNATMVLRLAERLSTAVVSVDRRSFPLGSRKVTGIGHGIDLAEFPCLPARGGDGLRLLALGRTSPAKGYPAVIEAVRLAAASGVDVTLELRGPSLTEEERAHSAELRRLAGGPVTVAEAVPRTDVPLLLAGVDALVNNMRAGAPDKVVYEAAASCRPVLASNPVFDELFAGIEPPLAFDREDPLSLAGRIETLAALSAEERTAIGRTLRERVEERHSVDSWADGVLRVLGV